MTTHQLSLEGKDVEPWKDICCQACWFAKNKPCVCRCGGVNHGKGRKHEQEDEKLSESKEYDLKVAEKQMENKHPDNVPPTLQWYDSGLGQKKTCRWCGGKLGPIQHKNHEGGWLVLGFAERQWLFKGCLKCGYLWALWKLGVSREEGEPQ